MAASTALTITNIHVGAAPLQKFPACQGLPLTFMFCVHLRFSILLTTINSSIRNLAPRDAIKKLMTRELKDELEAMNETW